MVLSPIALLGFPVLYVALLATTSNAAFIQAFNTFGARFGTSYTGIIESAKQAGAVVAPFSMGASIAVLPIVYATLAFPQSSVYQQVRPSVLKDRYPSHWHLVSS
jgi:hypothetical protein